MAPTNQKTLTSIDTHADTNVEYFTKFRTGFARITEFSIFPFLVNFRTYAVVVNEKVTASYSYSFQGDHLENRDIAYEICSFSPFLSFRGGV